MSGIAASFIYLSRYITNIADNTLAKFEVYKWFLLKRLRGLRVKIDTGTLTRDITHRKFQTPHFIINISFILDYNQSFLWQILCFKCKHTIHLST